MRATYGLQIRNIIKNLSVKQERKEMFQLYKREKSLQMRKLINSDSHFVLLPTLPPP